MVQLEGRPRVTGIYLGAFAAALCTAVLATPVARTVALKFGYFDIPGRGKSHVNPVPYLGGAAIILAFLLAVAAGGILGGFRGAYREMTVMIACALALSFIGLVDDLKGIKPLPKLGFEVLVGLGMYAGGIRVDLFNSAFLDLAITLVWVLGITNALNLLDNMDGLSAGVSAIAAVLFFGLAAYSGQFLVASLAVTLFGCALGFLWYNRPPARIHMGDSGSLFLGFILAVLGIKLKFDNLQRVTFLVPVLVMGVPILDTAVVLISRLKNGRSPFNGGKDHISHRLVRIGIPPKATVALIYFAALATGWFGATVSQSEPKVAYLIAAGLITIGCFFIWLLLKVEVEVEA